MASRSSWPQKAMRWLPWVSGLVLVAGSTAFLIAYLGSPAKQDIAASPNAKAVDVSGVPKPVPVDPKARLVAGQFITTAVTRKNLKKAWTLAEPNSFIRPKGLTYKQWLTGDIPVQFFPANAIDGASFRVETSYARELTLNVYIFAKEASGIASQPFYIVLHKRGNGKNARWLVNNFVPSSGAQVVPQGPDSAG